MNKEEVSFILMFVCVLKLTYQYTMHFETPYELMYNKTKINYFASNFKVFIKPFPMSVVG